LARTLSSGGGTGFLIRKPFTQLSLSILGFFSFESSFLTLKLHQSNLSFFNIYHIIKDVHAVIETRRLRGKFEWNFYDYRRN